MAAFSKERQNILFIMTDQQRADYTSIYGCAAPRTPAMDRIGAEGTVFRRAHVQAAVCGPSRACFYTGRYVHAHNSRWNEVPLRLTERTAGHYFEEAGYRAAVIGKTHMYADHPKPDFVKESSLTRDPRRLSRVDSVGFEYVAGGAWTPAVPPHAYIEYLRDRGYRGDGYRVISDAYYGYAPPSQPVAHPLRRPAILRAEDSEAHYLTDRAIRFMRETADRPWFLHLSFFRPHHPNIASEPYNEMYPETDFPAPLRIEEELRHPLFRELRAERNAHMGPAEDAGYCRHWRAVYAGLIKEIDDNLARLFDFMAKQDLLDRTLIVFTSDHGELGGDHWFFEKEMCYRQSHQVPLLIRCPGCPGGILSDSFVESVDVLPTCLEAAGLPIPPAVQGRSLLPLLRGETPDDWRQDTCAEWTFEYYRAAREMGLPPEKCRALLLRNEAFSYCHFNGLPDLLFDLRRDPDELHNVAEEPAYERTLHALKTRLLDWQLETWDPIPLRIDTGWPAKTGTGPKPEDMPYDFAR